MPPELKAAAADAIRKSGLISDQLIDPAAVAGELGVPEKTLAQWRYLGKGPRFIKVGRFIRYRIRDVERWLEEQSRSSTRSA